MTVVAPSVSADASFLIIAFRLANSRDPKAKVIVTTAGRPSGTAETARAIAMMKLSIKERETLIKELLKAYPKLVGHINDNVEVGYEASWLAESDSDNS